MTQPTIAPYPQAADARQRRERCLQMALQAVPAGFDTVIRMAPTILIIAAAFDRYIQDGSTQETTAAE